MPTADRATGDGWNTSSQPRIAQSPEPIGTGLADPSPVLPNPLPVETEPAKIEPDPITDCSHNPTKPENDIFESSPDKDDCASGIDPDEKPGLVPLIDEVAPGDNEPQRGQTSATELQAGCLKLEPDAGLDDPIKSIHPKVELDVNFKIDSKGPSEFKRPLEADSGLMEITGKDFGLEEAESNDHDELETGVKSGPGSNPGHESGSHFRSEEEKLVYDILLKSSQGQKSAAATKTRKTSSEQKVLNSEPETGNENPDKKCVAEESGEIGRDFPEQGPEDQPQEQEDENDNPKIEVDETDETCDEFEAVPSTKSSSKSSIGTFFHQKLFRSASASSATASALTTTSNSCHSSPETKCVQSG